MSAIYWTPPIVQRPTSSVLITTAISLSYASSPSMDSFTYIVDFLVGTSAEDPAESGSVPMNEDTAAGSGSPFCVIA